MKHLGHIIFIWFKELGLAPLSKPLFFALLILLSACTKAPVKIIGIDIKTKPFNIVQNGATVLDEITSNDAGDFVFTLICSPSMKSLEYSGDNGKTWQKMQDISCSNGEAVITYSPSSLSRVALLLRALGDLGPTDSLPFTFKFGGACDPLGVPGLPTNPGSNPFTITSSHCPTMAGFIYKLGQQQDFKCSDANGYTNTFISSLASSAPIGGQNVNEIINWSNWGPIGEGTIKFCFRFKTTSGLILGPEDAVEKTFIRDTIPPTAGVTGAPSGSTNVTTLNMSVSGTDVTQYKYKLASGAVSCTGSTGYSSPIDVSVPITKTSSEYNSYAQGSLYLCILGRDLAGNWQLDTAATSRTWVKDTLPPTAVLSGAPSGVSAVTSLNVTVSGDAQVTHYKYKIGSGALNCSGGYSTEVAVATSIQSTTAQYGLYDDGAMYLCVIGRDAAGNWQDELSATSQTWVKDSSAPAAIISGAPESPSKVLTLNITISGTDVTHYKYKLGAGALNCSTGYGSQIAVGTAIQKTSAQYGTSGSYPDGSIYLCVLGRDAAGNWQATASATSQTWVKDTVAPTVAITTPGSLYINNSNKGSYGIAGTCNDGSATISVKAYETANAANNVVQTGVSCSGTSWSTTMPSLAGLPEASVSFQATIADPALNESNSSVLNLTKDTLAPTVDKVQSVNANGTYKAGQSIQLKLFWANSENVKINKTGGSPTLALDIGQSATLSTGNNNTSSSFTLFDFTVSGGSNSSDLDYNNDQTAFTLNNGIITDLAGNPASLILPSKGGPSSLAGQSDIIIDTAPPSDFSLAGVSADTTDSSVDAYLAYVSANGNSFVKIHINPTSEGIDASTFTLAVYDAATGGTRKCQVTGLTGSDSISVQQSTCFPTRTLGTLYYLELTAFDAVGNSKLASNAKTLVRYIMTIDDSVPGISNQSITSGTDQNGTDGYLTNVASNTVTVGFDKQNTDTVLIKLIKVSDGTIICQSSLLTVLTATGNSVTLSGCSTLASETNYKLEFTAVKTDTGITNAVPFPFRTDWTVPTISISTPISNAYINDSSAASFLVKGSCSENGQAVTFYVDGVSVGTDTCNTAANDQFSVNLDLSSFSDKINPLYNLTAGIRDLAQNEKISTAVGVMKDTLPPSASLSGVPTSPSNTTDLNLTVSGTGVTNYKYKIVRGDTTNCLSSAGTYYGETSVGTPIQVLPAQYSAFSDGRIYICVLGKDAAGNWQAEASATTQSWMKDTQAPAATLVSGVPASPSNATTLAITIGGTDVTHYKYKMGTGSATCTGGGYGSETAVGTSVQKNTSEYAGFVDGTIYICVLGKDTAGNWQAEANATSQTWTKDTSAPAATLVSGVPASPSNATSLAITIGGTDVTHYKYKMGTGAATCTGGGYGSETAVGTSVQKNVSEYGGFVDGTIYICVLGKDTAGNWQTEANATSQTWTKDTQAPTAVLSGTPNSPSNTTTLNITVSGTGVSHYKYKIGTGNPASCSIASGSYGSETAIGTPISLNALAYNALSEGDLYLCVIGRDAAGNYQAAASATFHEWKKDTTAPTIDRLVPITGNGAYKAGAAIEFQIVWKDENVILNNTSGSPSMALNLLNGATTKAVLDPLYTNLTSSNTTKFIYTVASGDNTAADLDYASMGALVLNGAVIKDAAGNDAVLTLPAVGGGKSLADISNYTIDTTAPASFDLNGAQTNSADTTTDAFLTDVAATNVQIHFGTAVGASAYDMTVYAADGTTVRCTPPSGSSSPMVLSRSSCFPTTTSGTQYKIKLIARDAAGNTTSASNASAAQLYTLTIDTTVPVVSAIEITAGSDNTANSYLTDTNSGAVTVAFSQTSGDRADVSILNGTQTQTICSAPNVTVTSGANTQPLSNCTGLSTGSSYVLKVTSKKTNPPLEGNASIIFTVDTLVPTIGITTPTANAWVNVANAASFPINGNCNDTDATVDILLDGAVFKSSVACSGTSYSTTVDGSGWSQGNHTISARITDVAGNVSSSAVAVKVDTEAPKMGALTMDSTSTLLNQSPPITWPAATTQAGGTLLDLNKYEVKLDLEGWTSASTNTTYQFTGLGLSDSTTPHIVSVRVVDNAGNESTPVTSQWSALQWPTSAKQLIKDLNLTSASGFGTTMDISENGNFMVVGDPLANSGDGAISIYRWNSATWILVSRQVGDAAGGGGLGSSVSITELGSSTPKVRVVAGMPNLAPDGGFKVYHVQESSPFTVTDKTPTTLFTVNSVVANNPPEPSAGIGKSVLATADTIVIGAPDETWDCKTATGAGKNLDESRCGSIHVATFSVNAYGAWTKEFKPASANQAIGFAFGAALSRGRNDYVWIGSRNEPANRSDLYSYQLSTATLSNPISLDASLLIDSLEVADDGSSTSNNFITYRSGTTVTMKRCSAAGNACTALANYGSPFTSADGFAIRKQVGYPTLLAIGASGGGSPNVKIYVDSGSAFILRQTISDSSTSAFGSSIGWGPDGRITIGAPNFVNGSYYGTLFTFF